MKLEIWRWGPICTGIQIYPDFYTFNAKKEIYKWNGKGPQVGGHAVEIVGWGVETGKNGGKDIPFWIIRNSWGLEWGDNGYFRMIRGENNCKIESNVLTMVPDFFYPTGYRTGDNRSSPHKNTAAADDAVWDVYKPNKDAKIRDSISDNLWSTAGGIDPTTGYTRAKMVTMPWINFQRPVPLEDLPLWRTFVAGRDSTVKKRLQIKVQYQDSYVHERQERQVHSLYLGIIVFLVIAVLIVTIASVRNLFRR